jgi:hypothetical protein
LHSAQQFTGHGDAIPCLNPQYPSIKDIIMSQTDLDRRTDNINTFAENARRSAYDLADKTRGLADRASEWTESHAQDAAAALEEGSTRAKEFIQHRPVLTLALVIGASALAAYWMTRRPSGEY